ncbi:GAF domain-containing protein [Streptomyces sp. NPDC055078]
MTRPPASGRHTLRTGPAPSPADATVRERRLAELGLTRAARGDLDEAAAALGRDVGASYAMVNLLGEDGQFFTGLYRAPRGDLPLIGRTMRLTEGYCPSLLARRGNALVLTDVYDHPRFRSNLVVDQLGVGAYVGAPFVDPETGITLATVCFIDTVARPQDTEQELLHLIKSYRDALMPLLFPFLPHSPPAGPENTKENDARRP